MADFRNISGEFDKINRSENIATNKINVQSENESSIIDMLKPRPSFDDRIHNPYAKEERIMNICFDVVGLYGEERSMAMYEAGKRMGIYEKASCEG